MGERIGNDVSLCLFLQTIVTNHAGRVKCFVNVTRFEDMAHLLGVMGPDTGQTIRLQLHENGKLVSIPFGNLATQRVHFAGDPEKGLDMVADFVGDNICLREITRGMHPVFEILEKGQIDIEFPVTRTIKGPRGRLGISAGRFHGPSEKHQRRFFIGSAHSPEQLTPDVLGVGQNDGNELGQLIFIWVD